MFGFGNAAHPQREADVLVDRQVRVEPVALEHHRDVAVLGLQLVDQRSPIQISPSVHVLKPGDHPHGRGLAAARGPEQDKEFAVGDIEVEVTDATT
jgi:hypothetical protein